MKRVRWAARAIDQLEAIRDEFAEGDNDAGQRILDRIVLATDWLLDWPYAGREIAESGWRKWAPRRTGRVLIYRPREDGIEINSIRHERENWLVDF